MSTASVKCRLNVWRIPRGVRRAVNSKEDSLRCDKRTGGEDLLGVAQTMNFVTIVQSFTPVNDTSFARVLQICQCGNVHRSWIPSITARTKTKFAPLSYSSTLAWVWFFDPVMQLGRCGDLP